MRNEKYHTVCMENCPVVKHRVFRLHAVQINEDEILALLLFAASESTVCSDTKCKTNIYLSFIGTFIELPQTVFAED